MSAAFRVSDDGEGENQADNQNEREQYLYELEIDEKQNNKAKELRIMHGSRPHMRAFHCSWWSFFVTFFVWFAATPLLPDIQKTLHLTDEQIWNSSIAGVGGTILVRLIVGPLCDMYGARIPFAFMLCISSIPAALIGVVNNATGLTIVRFFIGFVGGTFVTCQYWTTSMFTLEIVGLANGVAAGWGNLGAGVSQLVIGFMLLPLFKTIFESANMSDEDAAELAWRTVSVIPALIALITGILIYFYSDDSPKGNYAELKKSGLLDGVSYFSSFSQAARHPTTWIMAIQYACCFGVELTMNNAVVMYFKREFSQSAEVAAAIAAIFGWMNLFARGLGGYLSDMAMAHKGMRGRIIVHSLFLFSEGALVLIFASTKGLGSATFVMVIFSIAVQASEGTTLGIVPYISPAATGSVIGIVGAGGNVGAVLFGLAFRQYHFSQAFLIMGGAVLCSTLLSAFVFVSKEHSSLFFSETQAGAPALLRRRETEHNRNL